MSTMNVSLPESLKAFVEKQVAERGYQSASEYVRELIRREQDRLHLRDLLIEGMQSPVAGVIDEAYFERLRNRVHQRSGE